MQSTNDNLMLRNPAVGTWNSFRKCQKEILTFIYQLISFYRNHQHQWSQVWVHVLQHSTQMQINMVILHTEEYSCAPERTFSCKLLWVTVARNSTKTQLIFFFLLAANWIEQSRVSLFISDSTSDGQSARPLFIFDFIIHSDTQNDKLNHSGVNLAALPLTCCCLFFRLQHDLGKSLKFELYENVFDFFCSL